MNSECISLENYLPVHAVIIPYLGANKLKLKLFPDCHSFAGEKYFPLRSEFINFSKPKRSIPEQASHILVALGGGNSGKLNQRSLKLY